MKNRLIGQGGRLISGISEMSETLNLKGHILTVDIEKVFDYLIHSFYKLILKNLDVEMTL